MHKFWNEKTKHIQPYVPGEQPKDKQYIKLNTNELPYPPSPFIEKELKIVDFEDLRLYPDPDVTELKKELASFYCLKENQVFVGNGSDEVLAMAFMTFFNKGDKIYYPNITYSFYSVYTHLFDLSEQLIPLKKTFEINIDDYQKLDGGIILANPNAPTTLTLTKNQIETILKSNKENIVIIDEAYVDFGAESVVDLIESYENLLVIQTFSKSRGLAGIRLGFALGNEALIEGLNRTKFSFNSYTIDRLAIKIGIASIKDKAYLKQTTQQIMRTRTHIIHALRNLNCFVLDSKTNFIFMTHPNISGEQLYLKLKEVGILVRYFKKEDIDNYIRITIGTDQEMAIFLKKIQLILQDTM